MRDNSRAACLTTEYCHPTRCSSTTGNKLTENVAGEASEDRKVMAAVDAVSAARWADSARPKSRESRKLLGINTSWTFKSHAVEPAAIQAISDRIEVSWFAGFGTIRSARRVQQPEPDT